MGILAWITGLVLIVAFGAAGISKLIDHQTMQEARNHLGFTKQQFQMIGAAELLGAIGVLIGLVSNGASYEWIGPLAGLGLLIVGVGAFLQHRKHNDPPNVTFVPLGLAIVALLYIIFVIYR